MADRVALLRQRQQAPPGFSAGIISCRGEDASQSVSLVPLRRKGESLPGIVEAKIFLKKGGEITLAISEQRKKELVADYRKWYDRSRVVILTEYSGLKMKDLDAIRAKAREIGAEFHIVKNTLGRIALNEAGAQIQEGFFEGSTAIGFAFEDAQAVAKMITEYARTNEFLKVKGGFLNNLPMSPDQVKSLADLPPLPVMRAQLLATIMASASQLTRMLAEPGRALAAVLKAYADKDAQPAETPA
jgi:large subunit ribosomal protein L10